MVDYYTFQEVVKARERIGDLIAEDTSAHAVMVFMGDLRAALQGRVPTKEEVARAKYESQFDHPEDVPWEQIGITTRRWHEQWAEEWLAVAEKLSE